jgi:hypothetical protein
VRSAPLRSVSSWWARIVKKSKYASQNEVVTANPSTAATITSVLSPLTSADTAPRPGSTVLVNQA